MASRRLLTCRKSISSRLELPDLRARQVGTAPSGGAAWISSGKKTSARWPAWVRSTKRRAPLAARLRTAGREYVFELFPDEFRVGFIGFHGLGSKEELTVHS